MERPNSAPERRREGRPGTDGNPAAAGASAAAAGGPAALATLVLPPPPVTAEASARGGANAPPMSLLVHGTPARESSTGTLHAQACGVGGGFAAGAGGGRLAVGRTTNLQGGQGPRTRASSLGSIAAGPASTPASGLAPSAGARHPSLSVAPNASAAWPSPTGAAASAMATGPHGDALPSPAHLPPPTPGSGAPHLQPPTPGSGAPHLPPHPHPHPHQPALPQGPAPLQLCAVGLSVRKSACQEAIAATPASGGSAPAGPDDAGGSGRASNWAPPHGASLPRKPALPPEARASSAAAARRSSLGAGLGAEPSRAGSPGPDAPDPASGAAAGAAGPRRRPSSTRPSESNVPRLGPSRLMRRAASVDGSGSTGPADGGGGGSGTDNVGGDSRAATALQAQNSIAHGAHADGIGNDAGEGEGTSARRAEASGPVIAPAAAAAAPLAAPAARGAAGGVAKKAVTGAAGKKASERAGGSRTTAAPKPAAAAASRAAGSTTAGKAVAGKAGGKAGKAAKRAAVGSAKAASAAGAAASLSGADMAAQAQAVSGGAEGASASASDAVPPPAALEFGAAPTVGSEHGCWQPPPAAFLVAAPTGAVGASLALRRVAPDLSVIPEESGSGSTTGTYGTGSVPPMHDVPPAGDGACAAAAAAVTMAVPPTPGALPSPGPASTPSAAAAAGVAEVRKSAGAAKSRRAGPTELDPSAFQLGRVLGSGSFATVYLARQVDKGARVVVKRLDRRPAGRAAQSEADNEVAVLTRAGFHPNLVEFRGWYRDPRDGVTCLVMGYCGGGTLAQLIKNPPHGDAGRAHGGGGAGGEPAPGAFGTTVISPPGGGGGPGGGDVSSQEADALAAAAAAQRASYFPEDLVMFWFVQLLLALHHLHGRRIMHRDLKPDNIFLASHRRVVKLGDLGVAKQLEGTWELAITCLGTPYYMSPECLASRPYTYASDIWSLGCVLYEMAARRTAFEALGLPQLMFKILRVAYDPLPPQFSRPFQQLVNCMLRADPEDRPTTQDLLSQPFVRRHLKRLLDIAGRKTAAATAADRPSAMPPMVKPSEARSAVKRLERASIAKAGSSAAEAKRRRGSAAAAAAAAAAAMVEEFAAPGARPFSTGGGKLNSPRAYGAGVSPAAGGGGGGPGGGGGGFGGGSGAAAARGKGVLQWDSGARYEARRQQQVERRFRAREFEQRITREQVRQQRRERDPAVRAREAEMELLRQELLARRERKQAQAAEQEILQERLTDPRVIADGELAAFRTRNRLQRTQLQPHPHDRADSAAPSQDAGLEEAGYPAGDPVMLDESYHIRRNRRTRHPQEDGEAEEGHDDVSDDDADVDIPEEYDFDYSDEDFEEYGEHDDTTTAAGTIDAAIMGAGHAGAPGGLDVPAAAGDQSAAVERDGAGGDTAVEEGTAGQQPVAAVWQDGDIAAMSEGGETVPGLAVGGTGDDTAPLSSVSPGDQQQRVTTAAGPAAVHPDGDGGGSSHVVETVTAGSATAVEDAVASLGETEAAGREDSDPGQGLAAEEPARRQSEAAEAAAASAVSAAADSGDAATTADAIAVQAVARVAHTTAASEAEAISSGGSCRGWLFPSAAAAVGGGGKGSSGYELVAPDDGGAAAATRCVLQPDLHIPASDVDAAATLGAPLSPVSPAPNMDGQQSSGEEEEQSGADHAGKEEEEEDRLEGLDEADLATAVPLSTMQAAALAAAAAAGPAAATVAAAATSSLPFAVAAAGGGGDGGLGPESAAGVQLRAAATQSVEAAGEVAAGVEDGAGMLAASGSVVQVQPGGPALGDDLQGSVDGSGSGSSSESEEEDEDEGEEEEEEEEGEEGEEEEEDEEDVSVSDEDEGEEEEGEGESEEEGDEGESDDSSEGEEDESEEEEEAEEVDEDGDASVRCSSDGASDQEPSSILSAAPILPDAADQAATASAPAPAPQAHTSVDPAAHAAPSALRASLGSSLDRRERLARRQHQQQQQQQQQQERLGQRPQQRLHQQHQQQPDRQELARSFQDLEQQLREVWDEQNEGAMRRVLDRIWSLTLLQRGEEKGEEHGEAGEGQGARVVEEQARGWSGTGQGGMEPTEGSAPLDVATAAAAGHGTCLPSTPGCPGALLASRCGSTQVTEASAGTGTGTGSSLSFGAALEAGLSAAGSLPAGGGMVAEGEDEGAAAAAAGGVGAPGCEGPSNEERGGDISGMFGSAADRGLNHGSPWHQSALDFPQQLYQHQEQRPRSLIRGAAFRSLSPPVSPTRTTTPPQPFTDCQASPTPTAALLSGSPERYRRLLQPAPLLAPTGLPAHSGAAAAAAVSPARAHPGTLGPVRPPLEWALPPPEDSAGSTLGREAHILSGGTPLGVAGSTTGRGLGPLRTPRPSSGCSIPAAGYEPDDSTVTGSPLPPPPPQLPLQPLLLQLPGYGSQGQVPGGPVQHPGGAGTAALGGGSSRHSLAPLREDAWSRPGSGHASASASAAAAAAVLSASVSAPSALALGLLQPPVVGSGVAMAGGGGGAGCPGAVSPSKLRPPSQDGNQGLPPVNPASLPPHRRQGVSRVSSATGGGGGGGGTAAAAAAEALRAWQQQQQPQSPSPQKQRRGHDGDGLPQDSRGQHVSSPPRPSVQLNPTPISSLMASPAGQPLLRVSQSHRGYHTPGSPSSSPPGYGVRGAAGGDGGYEPESGAGGDPWVRPPASGRTSSGLALLPPLLTASVSGGVSGSPLKGTPGGAGSGSAAARRLHHHHSHAHSHHSHSHHLLYPGAGGGGGGGGSQPSSARASRTPSYTGPSGCIGGVVSGYDGDGAGGGGDSGVAGATGEAAATRGSLSHMPETVGLIGVTVPGHGIGDDAAGYGHPADERGSGGDSGGAGGGGGGAGNDRGVVARRGCRAPLSPDQPSSFARTSSPEAVAHQGSCPPLPPLQPSQLQGDQGSGGATSAGSGSNGERAARPVSPIAAGGVAPPAATREGLAAAGLAGNPGLGGLVADIRRWKIDRSRQRAVAVRQSMSAAAAGGAAQQQQNDGK